MVKEPKVSFALDSAGQKLRYAKTGEATVRGLLEHAERELANATEAHNLNKSLLISGEAAAAEGEGADLIRLRKDFIKTRDNIDFMASRVEGVKQLVSAAAIGLELAKANFADQWREHAGRELSDFTDEYNAAVRVLLTVIDRGLALSLALGTPEANRMFYRLGRQQILSLGPDERLFYRFRDSWKADEAAVKLYQETLDLGRELRGEKATAMGT